MRDRERERVNSERGEERGGNSGRSDVVQSHCTPMPRCAPLRELLGEQPYFCWYTAGLLGGIFH